MEDGFKKFITHYKKDEAIYKVGDVQADFYIINNGKIQLKLEGDDKPIVTISKGDFFGEESLTEGQTAIYTAEVIEDADVIKIPYNALLDMIKKNSPIALKILKKLTEKHIKIMTNTLQIMQKPAPASKKAAKKAEAAPVEEEKTSEMLPPDIKAYLVIERSNRVVQLTKTHTYLGRRDYTTGSVPDVDLTKEDEEKYISRRHSQISYVDGKFYLSEEPGTVNGTFLNGNRLATGVKHELKDKDEITLCHLNITFKH